MKITIYELLGIVKDGKAPKNARIRYFDRNNDYYDECNLKENEIINRLHFGNIELNDEVEILEEEKELHANDIEFNINNDKRDCIITLDENDLGIDKLHLDNCYFYKENDKWYIKKYDFKNFNLEEKKIPEKLPYYSMEKIQKAKNKDEWREERITLLEKRVNDLHIKMNELLDYLKSKGE